LTFPAEPVVGTMVAQTNTVNQLNATTRRAAWKGTLIQGLEGQVFPPDHQNALMQIARDVEARLPEIATEIFGQFEHPFTDLDRRLWDSTQWTFRTDHTYLQVAEETLASSEPFDLFLFYLGGPDVVGHRFWRYYRPDEFAHPASSTQIDNFSRVIPDYYRYVDRAIGRILELAPPQANVLIVSDHGMHAVNTERQFRADDTPENINSGDHEGAAPGVLLAAGPSLKGPSTPSDGSGLVAGDLPILGSVLDIVPTALALQGLPIGRDMDARIIEACGADSSHDGSTVTTPTSGCSSDRQRACPPR
jgi:hypothetical protein